MTETTPTQHTFIPAFNLALLRPNFTLTSARRSRSHSSDSSSTSSASVTAVCGSPQPQLLTEAALQELEEELGAEDYAFTIRSESNMATEGSVATVRATIHKTLSRESLWAEAMDAAEREVQMEEAAAATAAAAASAAAAENDMVNVPEVEGDHEGSA